MSATSIAAENGNTSKPTAAFPQVFPPCGYGLPKGELHEDGAEEASEQILLCRRQLDYMFSKYKEKSVRHYLRFQEDKGVRSL